MACEDCSKRFTCENSADYTPKNDATRNKALAIRELASRLNLPPEFIHDNLERISEILTTFKPKECVYP